MINVGWIGLGKLGAPCAAALAYHGNHALWGYDVRGVDPGDYDWSDLPPINLCVDINHVVRCTNDIVYVAVQTPHSPEYGGETPTPIAPREFEYAYLINAVRAVCDAAERQRKHITLVVVSTVLPGTFDRYLRPLLNQYVTPIYHPFFIAMGTVVEDFTRPEMRIFGADDPLVVERVHEIYAPLNSAPAPTMSIASAELTKVAYNTFISMKIIYANLMAEMCDVTGADVDDVTGSLASATDRILSPRYLSAGMGDGGACHPRDNVALSALAQRFNLSSDLMGFLNEARDRQAQRFAELIIHWHLLARLPVALLGRSYKPNVTLTDGSPALLLAYYLDQEISFTHHEFECDYRNPQIYFVATKHDEYTQVKFPAGSVVIDPFGYLTINDPAVTLVTPGRKR